MIRGIVGNDKHTFIVSDSDCDSKLHEIPGGHCMRMMNPEYGWEDGCQDVGYTLTALNTPEKDAAATCLLNVVPVEQGRCIHSLLLHTTDQFPMLYKNSDYTRECVVRILI